MDLDKILSEFKAYLKRHICEENTIKNYNIAIRKFLTETNKELQNTYLKIIFGQFREEITNHKWNRWTDNLIVKEINEDEIVFVSLLNEWKNDALLARLQELMRKEVKIIPVSDMMNERG